MSSFLLFGNFAVAGARRVSSTKNVSDANGERTVVTSHYVYDTTISVRNPPSVQASLRVYSPPNDIAFPDESIVFAVVKAYAPINDTILLDAINIFRYPGDCDDDAYEEGIIDIPATFASFTGFVRGAVDTVEDPDQSPRKTDHSRRRAEHSRQGGDHSRAFLADVSEYVRDVQQSSLLQAVFDGTSPRWKKIPIPNRRSTVHVFGHCRGIASNGSLAINVDNIALNVGTWIPAQATIAAMQETTPPSKRRKLSAYSARHGNTSTSNIQPMPSTSSSATAFRPVMPFNIPSQPMENPVHDSSMLSMDQLPESTLNALTNGLSLDVANSASLPIASSSSSTLSHPFQCANSTSNDMMDISTPSALTPVPIADVEEANLPLPSIDTVPLKGKGKRKART